MKKLRWIVYQYKEFGASVALSTALNRLYKYGPHQNSLSIKINDYKHRCIISSLERKYKHVIEKYKMLQWKEDELKQSNIIWTIWWQGEENAPEAIKMCFESMRANSNGRKVIVITENNISMYIQLPEFIMNKVKRKDIGFIHLADIIRMNLLYKYGGMWLDATIFLTEQISNEIFEKIYYTGKLERTKMPCVSEGRWNGTFFAGFAGNPFFAFMKEFYEEYWEYENQVIDYFLIDYMTEIAYRNLPYYKKMLDDVPLNNLDIFKLGSYLNDQFDESLYTKYSKHTGVHKLQRRNEYVRKDTSNNMTLYGFLCKKYNV